MKEQLDRLKSMERSLRNKRIIEHQLRKEIKQDRIKKPKTTYLSPLVLSPLSLSSKKKSFMPVSEPFLSSKKSSSPFLLSADKSSTSAIKPSAIKPSAIKPSAIKPIAKTLSAITLSIKEPSVNNEPALTEQDIINIVPEDNQYESSPPPYEAIEPSYESLPAYPEQPPTDISFENGDDLSYRD